MRKIAFQVAACMLLASCGQNESESSNTLPPAPILVKDTEARDLKGNVKSVISVSWQMPSETEINLAFDSLYQKVTKHIAKYNSNADPSFALSEAEALEANRAHIQKDAFDTSGSMIFLAQHKKMWRLRRSVREKDVVAYFDTTIDGNIYYHDTTTLANDRSISRIIDEFITVTDSAHYVKTRLDRQNISRNDSAIVWVHTTSISGDLPKLEPATIDTVTYKILEKDGKGNLLKVVVGHTDKSQPKELILYKYTYYDWAHF